MVVGTLHQRVTLNRFGEQEIRKIRTAARTASGLLPAMTRANDNAALRGLLHTRVANP
jgi:hypothetical protein